MIETHDWRGPGEECGVFGMFAPRLDVARVTFFALYALQHRGQESAGIATTDGGQVFLHRGMGLVTQVFDEDALKPLSGDIAIGHTRYSTTGGSHLRNAQPYVLQTARGPLGIAHNGNLTNAAELRKRVLARGSGLSTASDSELLLHLLMAPSDGAAKSWGERMLGLMEITEGAYTVVVLTHDGLYGMRDPQGFRPMCIGTVPLPDGTLGHVLSSESCALETIGATFVREVNPGEVVRIDRDGITSWQHPTAAVPALCVFEYVYFARPDSQLEDQTVHDVRDRLGRRLAEEAPCEADVVVGVPDSALPAAVGYAETSGIPYREGLIKNRYIGRTFIQPDADVRRDKVRLKYNPLRSTLEGKRVVLVDDSIVRGSTAGPLVRLLREAGAIEVHVRVSSPPVRFPCFMGVDLGYHDELIAHDKSIEAIRQHIGADSLAFLTHDGLLEVVRGPQPDGHCTACFTGDYPLPIGGRSGCSKSTFEGIHGE